MQVTIGVKGGARKALFETVAERAAVAVPAIDIGRLDDPKVRSYLGHSVPLLAAVGAILQGGATQAFAATAAPISHPPVATAPGLVEAGAAAIPAISEGLKSTVLHAFDPLIDLIVTLSYPIAGVMIAGGCLFIMVGQRDRGMGMLQNAAIGYILVQLSPMLLKLIVGIGESV